MKFLLRLKMRFTAARIEALQKEIKRTERELEAAFEEAQQLRAMLFALERPAIVQ